MELQAVRYASMISNMTFEQAVRVHAAFLTQMGEPAEEAEGKILDFLDWDEPDEDSFADDIRIILVSEDFGKELTTAVLWLRSRDLDIRCVRLKPYQDEGKKFIDGPANYSTTRGRRLSGTAERKGTEATEHEEG